MMRSMLALGAMIVCATAATCAPIATAKAAEEAARADFEKRFRDGAPTIVIGQPNPKWTIDSVKTRGEKARAFEVEVQATKTGDGKPMTVTWTRYVMKDDGRQYFGPVKGARASIDAYASLTRSARGVLGVLNQLAGTMEYTQGDDFASKAHGDSYYCLLMVFGKRFVARMPVKPIDEKLPEWARKNAEHKENGLAVRMFREAYPIDFADEKFLRASGATDPAARTAVSLYPSLAKRLGVEADPSVQPLKLEGWAKHGDIYAQDCSERAAAELLLRLNLVVKAANWEFEDMFLVGSGEPEGTLFASFRTTSIHNEVNWGRPIVGAFRGPSGKTYPSMCDEIAAGNESAITAALNFPELRALIEKAAAKHPEAKKALEKLPSF